MAKTSVFILTPDFPAVDGCAMIGGSYVEALASAKKFGYDGVEITMGDPDKFDVPLFQKALSEQGLSVSAVNSGGINYLFKAALVSDDPKVAEFAFEKVKGYIRICSQLGCFQQVGVARGFAVPGRPMRWFKDFLVDVLKAAASYAAGLNVNMVFEYTNRFEINTINTGAESREIVDRVASPNLGMLVDTYHSFLEDPDVCENLVACNGRVRHFHLHDTNGDPAIVGKGEHNWDRILETCAAIGYDGWFSDGLFSTKYSENELQRSTTTLRELYRKYGL